jgi:hypothetical protein
MRTLTLLLAAGLCSCANAPKPSPAVEPLPAHLIASDGVPVPGAPEPEVVQLKKIEDSGGTKHITVGNIAGDYVLVCNLDANKEYGVKSCFSPRPQQEYLLFRRNTKWLKKGAEQPMNLQFMQDFSVTYNNAENVGLLPARNSNDEYFGVYWVLSWTAKSPAH